MTRVTCSCIFLALALPISGRAQSTGNSANTNANASAIAQQAATARLAEQNAQAQAAENNEQRNAAARKQQSATTDVPTLRAYSRLVVVDVVVSNHGQPVTGLKQSDFTVLEGKTPQTIRSFEAHTSGGGGAVQPAPAAKLPVGVFSNQAAAATNSALNILLIDTLNTPTQDQSFARQQLLEYLKTAKGGNNTAIFGLTTRLNLLQGFTTDPGLLRRVVDKKLPQGSTLLDDPVGGRGVQDSLSDQLSDAGVGADVVYNFATFEALNQNYLLTQRVKYTLDALNTLARYLSALPGRKNLIWFSGSFPINILPDPDSAGDPFAGSLLAEPEYRQTSNLLSRSQVAVYPIDVRGLFVSPSISAATGGTRYGRNPANYGKDQIAFAAKTNNERSTMIRMAEDTGGKAFVGTNGLAEAVAQAVDFGSSYYTLSYVPAEAASRESYRAIQVKLAQSGYNLSYRRGYFGDDPAGSAVSAAQPGRGEALHQAAMFGAPPATQVQFKTLVRMVNHEDEAAPAEGNFAEANGKNAKGPWNRYLVRFSVDANTITIAPPADGKRGVGLEFVTLVYDQDGNRVNSVDNTINTKIPEANFAGIQQSGLLYQQQVSAPVKGDYRLRILVNDEMGNRLGAVEVALGPIKTLPVAIQ